MNLNDFIGLEVKLEGKVGEVNPNGSVVLEEKPWKATHNGCQYPTMVYRNVSNFDEIAEQLKKDDWVKGIGKITEVREFIPLASGDFLSFGI